MKSERRRADNMKVGAVYGRKDYEYIVVAVVKHKNKDSNVYMVEKRKYGSEKIEYFVQEHEFGEGFRFEGHIQEDGCIY